MDRVGQVPCEPDYSSPYAVGWSQKDVSLRAK